MNDSVMKLYEQFVALAEGGDEAAARKFLADHIMEFPEDLREKITFAFFEDAIHQKAEEVNVLASLQKQASEAIATVAKADKEIENAEHIEEIQNSLRKKE